MAELARHLSWQEAARHFRLDWKGVAWIVQRVVAYGRERRRRRPLHVLGIDEVSRRKGHHYLTIVYDLERGVLLWVGEDRTEQTLTRFFTGLGRRRSRTIQVVCLDMWQPFKEFVRRLRAHRAGVLPWTRRRVSNGAREGMNNKIKLVSHRSFGFRTVKNFTAAIYHCCAHLPLPEEC